MRIEEKEFLLLAASVASNFGSALTLTFIVFVLAESLGVASISYGFLIQNLPAMLISPRLLAWMVWSRRLVFYKTLLTVIAIIVLGLCTSQSILQIYLFMMASWLLGAVSMPVGVSLIGDRVGMDRVGIFKTRVYLLQPALWAAAPVLDGLLYSSIGLELVVAIDALTFFITGIVISFLGSPSIMDLLAQELTSQRASQSSLHHEALQSDGNTAYFVWHALGLVLCILNGIAFAVLLRAGFAERTPGFVLGAWGAGGLFAFCATSARLIHQRMTAPIAAVRVISTTMFARAHVFFGGGIFMFVMGSWGAAISGRIGQVVERSLRNASKALIVSSRMQKRTPLISLLSCFALGLLFANGLCTESAFWVLPTSMLFLRYFRIRVDRWDFAGKRGAVL